MSTLQLRSLILIAIVATASAQSCPSCEIGCNVTTCFELDANQLTFHCRRVNQDSTNPVQVLLLHGFPEWSHHWVPIMEYWNNNKFAIDAVACDLRGYSPLASPNNSALYDYSILESDIWAIADELGFDTFHLIGYDHGAALGWKVASNKSKSVSGRVVSYSALSVPHPDTFSDAIYGDNNVEEQVIASNYFNQFAVENSATINGNALSLLFDYGGFEEAESFQKALWWYNGSIGKYMARPPVVHVNLTEDGFLWMVQHAIPLPQDNGSAAVLGPIGNIPSFCPTLFVCGSEDPYLLCTLPYVSEQEKLIDGEYSVLNVQCGHDLMTCDGNETAVMIVFETLTEHILDTDSGAVSVYDETMVLIGK